MSRFPHGVVVVLVLAASAVSFADPPGGKPGCEPGYVWVEETCYREVVTKCCKLVPDVKKVTRYVYDIKEEDFCLTKCRCPVCCKAKGHCAEQPCPECGKPRCKKRLVKREVVEERPRYKCVVECVVEKVPYTVYRKVPCPAVPPTSFPR
jgi:hypothetical protein